MHIFIDNKSGAPIYDQIKTQIKSQIISGELLPDETLPEGLKAIRGRYAPELTMLVKSPARAEALDRLAPFTREMTAVGGRPTYYVCQGGHCSLPVTE